MFNKFFKYIFIKDNYTLFEVVIVCFGIMAVDDSNWRLAGALFALGIIPAFFGRGRGEE